VVALYAIIITITLLIWSYKPKKVVTLSKYDDYI
jgi:hypothetical protein